MEQINFRGWRLVASIVDTDILRLEIEALDGSDIVELDGVGADREGDHYVLRLSTQAMEEAQAQRRAGVGGGAGAHDLDEDETGPAWLADEDETIYLRGWEVDALVDEDNALTVTVVRGEGAEIFEVEPLESGIALSPRIVVRLAAEDTGEDEDEDEDEDGEELESDEFEDLDQFHELDDDYEDEEDYLDDDDEEDDLFTDDDTY
jgi:hypothetical protein